MRKVVKIIMSNFTYFLRCCCQSACEDEEEKKASECIKNDTISGKIKDFNRDYIEEPFIIDAHQPYCDSSLLETLKLEVKVLESDKIPAGTTVIINPAGMEGSKRGKLDGKTFFGCSPEENGEILNDFAVDDSSEGAIRQYFYISFNQKSMKYCITDLDQGPGTFLRIDSPIVLKDGFIISFGNSHITVHYNPISK